MIDSDELGLCETCNYIYSCSLHKRYNQPVWQCVEFDDSDRTEENLVIDNNSRKMDQESLLSANLKNANLYIGLCSNCKNRKSCTYPIPEGGIWCCEEYE